MLFFRMVLVFWHLPYFKSILHQLEINLHQNSCDSRWNQLTRLTLFKINTNDLTKSNWIKLDFMFVLWETIQVQTQVLETCHIGWSWRRQLLLRSKPGSETALLHHHPVLTQLLLRVEHQFRPWAPKTYSHELSFSRGLFSVFKERILNLCAFVSCKHCLRRLSGA